jgi:hypothetical protein
LGRGCTEGRTGVFKGVGPTCAGDPVIGTHMCMHVHRIDTHASAGKGIMGIHYGRACWLNRRAHVRTCRLNRRAYVYACIVNMRAYVVNRCAHVRAYVVNRSV